MMNADQKYDVIILGSGIAGLGVAYGLVRRGKKVLLLSPKKPLKGESTPASAGILDPFLESASPKHPFFRLKKKAFLKLPRQFREIERESGMKIGYARTGMFFTALNKAEEQKLKSRLAMHKPAGIPVQWVAREQALRQWPYLGDAVRGVLFYPTLGRVFPAQFRNALRCIVKRRGATELGIKGRVKLLVEKGRVAGVVLDKKKITAPSVINAGGCWADQIKFSPLRVPVFPVRGQVVVVRGNVKKLKTVAHSAGGIYIVPWEPGTCLLGSTVERVGFKASVEASVLKKIRREAAQMIPALNSFQPVTSWAGLRPCSEDQLPILGKTAVKGYYMAAGYYRSGIVISLYAGELLAKGIVGKGFSKELVPFSPSRFTKDL